MFIKSNGNICEALWHLFIVKFRQYTKNVESYEAVGFVSPLKPDAAGV